MSVLEKKSVRRVRRMVAAGLYALVKTHRTVQTKKVNFTVCSFKINF